MSLQIWLPLISDTSNQGVYNSAISSNGLKYTAGKLGNAAEFSSSYITIKNTPITGSIVNFSFAFWMKTSNPSNTSCIYNGRTAMGEAFSIFLYNGYFRVDDGSHCYFSYNVPKDTWEHYCITRDSNNIKLYVNGKLKQTTNSTTFTCSATIATIGVSSINGEISSNYLQGKLNDYRIYDHCLSPKEVKEISKGLACHYKLSKLGNENLIKGCFSCTSTNAEYSQTGVVTCTLSKDDILNNKGNTLVFSYDIYSMGNYTQNTPGSWNANRFGIHGCFKYTKTGATSATQTYPLAGLLTRREKGRIYTTWTVPTDIETINENLMFSIQTNKNSGFAYPASDNNETWYIKNVKLEWGKVPTPYIPNAEDSTYKTFGYDDTTVYDCSGYGNNGVMNNGTYISANVDSPRYDTCYKLVNDGSPYIDTPNFSFENMPQGTVSMWINRHSTDSTWRNYLMFANGYNWVSGGLDFIIFGSTGGQPIVMDCCSNTYAYTPDLNKWYLYTLTWDFSTKTVKFYINGELKQTTVQDRIGSTDYTTKHNQHFIGNANYKVSDYSLSDFRLYATALSDADIKELYNTPISLTNTGVLMTQGEFKEV